MGVRYQEMMTFTPDTLQKMAACIFPGLIELVQDELDKPWRWLVAILFRRTKHPEIDESVPFTTRTFVANCIKTGYFQSN